MFGVQVARVAPELLAEFPDGPEVATSIRLDGDRERITGVCWTPEFRSVQLGLAVKRLTPPATQFRFPLQSCQEARDQGWQLLVDVRHILARACLNELLPADDTAILKRLPHFAHVQQRAGSDGMAEAS